MIRLFEQLARVPVLEAASVLRTHRQLSIFGLAMRHAGSQFPNRESNLHLLCWKHSLNHWTASEVPPPLNFIFLIIYLFSFSVGSLHGCAGSSLVAARRLLVEAAPTAGKGSRGQGSMVVPLRPSCAMACGVSPDQGSSPCLLH